VKQSKAKQITPRAKARRKRKVIVQDEVTPNGVMRGTLSSLVMRGLDPRIHLLRKKSYEVDGLPGQARQ